MEQTRALDRTSARQNQRRARDQTSARQTQRQAHDRARDQTSSARQNQRRVQRAERAQQEQHQASRSVLDEKGVEEEDSKHGYPDPISPEVKRRVAQAVHIASRMKPRVCFVCDEQRFDCKETSLKTIAANQRRLPWRHALNLLQAPGEGDIATGDGHQQEGVAEEGREQEGDPDEDSDCDAELGFPPGYRLDPMLRDQYSVKRAGVDASWLETELGIQFQAVGFATWPS